MASSSIVMKVRFGETLHRLNVSINDGKLALDVFILKEKIRSFFSFGSDVDFTMTYVDEDGDAVTLSDNDDLLDVVRQALNPLRITVNLNGNNVSGPSGISASLKSPQNQHSFQNLNSEVAEILKSFLEALAKLPLDLASKASSSAPAVAELVEKMKAVYLDPILTSMASPTVYPTTGGSPIVNSESSTVKNSKVQVNSEAGGSNLKKKGKQARKVTEGVKFKDVQPPRGVDLNIPHSGYGFFKAPISSTKSVGEGSTGKNKDTTDGVDKKKDSSFEKKDDISSGSLNEALKHGSFIEHMIQVRQNQINQRNQNVQNQIFAQRAQFSQAAQNVQNQGMLNALNQCPFYGMPLTTDSESHGYPSRSPLWKRDSLDNNSMNDVFHIGIICDGCGAHPITGPRFNSKVKNNYDLCHFCFVGMGNATDYIRMDQPTNTFKEYRDLFMPYKSACIPSPPLPHAMLDSMFILDVSVLDGTIMTPFTAFTKIWRMRNNGSFNWPYGSQIQWIEGDHLSSALSVDVEIPMNGLPVGKELDISVNFTAPELPGRHISYWQMASPSGQKFGQQVWVIIQVDDYMKNLGDASFNLNLPPITRNQEAVNQDHLVDNIFSGNNVITDPENTFGYLPPKDHEMISALPETDSFSGFNSRAVRTALGSLPAGSMDTESVSYPEVDFTVMPSVMRSGAASLPMVVDQPPLASDDREQDPAKVLEAMGFKQLDLNEEVLRINNYDLDKSIDDLCGVLEWDPMLDELQEMGFADVEANRRLLKKNNGSIKGVVMDLINEEKA